jgi:hypothetical protein
MWPSSGVKNYGRENCIVAWFVNICLLKALPGGVPDKQHVVFGCSIVG